MQVFENIKSLREAISTKRGPGISLGFVPTMGALHQGHLSLLDKAKSENDLVAFSIFVNPTQFNNAEDLKNYPRTLESDLDMLKVPDPDFAFVPPVEEIYPKSGAKVPCPDLGILEHVMEGEYRPGHFRGVVQVVSRLFEIVGAERAYFGEKDFQQLAIIREMTVQLGYKTEIRSCPTVRESDGLAMSSRNSLLSPKERKAAAAISKALFFVRDNFRQYSIPGICEEAVNRIEAGGLMKVEYLEIADSFTLEPLLDWSQSTSPRVFTAVKIGKVRLIDNVGIRTDTGL
jgi:pantoate--beta-alanine ligase